MTRRSTLPRLLALALCTPLLAGCPGEEPLDPVEAHASRALAAAHFASGRMEAARDALAPLLDRRDPDPEDVLRGAIVDLALFESDAARAKLLSVRDELQGRAEVDYGLGLAVETSGGDLEEALPHYSRAHELRPDCFPTHVKLASTLKQLRRDDEAAAHFEELLAVGLDFSGSWYMTVLYQLAQILVFVEGQEDRAQGLLAEWTALDERGITVPSPNDIDRGELAVLHPPAAMGTAVAARPTPPAFTAVGESGVEGAVHLAAATLVERWNQVTDNDGVVTEARVGPQALLCWGGGGLWRVGAGEDAAVRLLDGPVDHVLVCSLDRDPKAKDRPYSARVTSMWVARGAELELYDLADDALVRSPLTPGALPSAIRGLALVDYDHEGDLDLLAVGDFGARLLRSDGVGIPGAEDPGAFVDATLEAGLPTDRAFAWAVVEDYDTDGDADLLLGGPDGALLASNARGGRFEDASERLPDGLASDTAPVVADLDGDALPDLWLPGATPRLFRQRPSGRFEEDDAGPALPGGGEASAADVDLDGALDVMAAGGGRLALGLPEETTIEPPLAGEAVVLADFDDDLAGELAVLAGGEVYRFDAAPAGGGLRLALVGVKDNRRGVGAVVEVLAGPIYRRIFWRGEPVTVGLGGRDVAEVVRVIWPNGVVQYLTEVPAGASRAIVQSEGLVGSCPFLYAWNGEEYEFISDVLGITPLGLPMAPGVIVPPDHDEYVLVRGDQLAPKDGWYELQFTEELREVTYVDRARLDVIDHPVGTQVWPNERFCFPPFPEHHVHTTRELLAPTATDGVGRDWSAELAAVDGELSAPFEAYSGQLLGLATPHTLELAFDPNAVRGAEKLRLVMTGWFYWTDASVNVASARTPGIEFVPPVLQVPDVQGGWRDTGPPIGFPAGKTKTMVIDVTELLDRENPRLRLFSTLRLYWDSIRLAVDADDAPYTVTPLEPAYANLWERGYTAPIVIDEEHGLEWFQWDYLECHPRWNQHPGMYTRHGDVLPLLGEVDDRFVIMGSGDALTLRFDASLVPPLEDGWTRDFLVYLDGWAKDRDPNTVEALRVEPLPFHGMSAYPYGEDEHFPDDEEHRAWRREWNTRPAKQWIEPLAPRARLLYPQISRR